MLKISVIVPTYNRAKLLPATIGAIRRQTLPAYEIIVVDDGSTDETREVLSQLGPGLKVLFQENAGVSAARNAGARIAQGDILAFCDSDDQWLPEKLEIQARIHETYPSVGWTTGDAVTMDPEGVPSPGIQGFSRSYPVFQHVGPPEEFFQEDLDQISIKGSVGAGPVTAFVGNAFRLLLFGNFGSPTALTIDRQLFTQLKGFDDSFRCAEETEFFLRASDASHGAIVMRPLFDWRRGHAALTDGGNTIAMIENAIAALDRTFEAREGRAAQVVAAYEVGRAIQVSRLAFCHVSNGDGAAARAVLRDARRQGFGIRLKDRALIVAGWLPVWTLEVLRGIPTLRTRVQEVMGLGT